MASKCRYCEGRGSLLLAKTWFVADGFRRVRCSVCGGSRNNPTGFIATPDHLAFQHNAISLVAEWGALKPRVAA